MDSACTGDALDTVPRSRTRKRVDYRAISGLPLKKIRTTNHGKTSVPPPPPPIKGRRSKVVEDVATDDVEGHSCSVITLPESAQGSWRAPVYTGPPVASTPFEFSHLKTYGPVYLSKAFKHFAKGIPDSTATRYDPVQMARGGDRPKAVVELNAILDQDCWVPRMITKIKRGVMTLLWWGSPETSQERNETLAPQISKQNLEDLENEHKLRQAEESLDFIEPTTKLEWSLAAMVMQCDMERKVYLLACHERMASELKRLSKKGSRSLTESASDSLKKPYINIIEDLLPPYLAEMMIPETAVGHRTEYAAKRGKSTDTVTTRTIVHTFRSLADAATYFGVESVIYKGTGTGGKDEVAIIGPVAEWSRRIPPETTIFKDMEQAELRLLSNTSVQRTWKGSPPKSQVMKDFIKSGNLQLLLVLDSFFLRETEIFLCLRRSLDSQDPLCRTHNILGVSLFGELGHVPSAFVSVIAAPQMIIDESYREDVLNYYSPIPMLSKISLRWRCWYVRSANSHLGVPAIHPY